MKKKIRKINGVRRRLRGEVSEVVAKRQIREIVRSSQVGLLNENGRNNVFAFL